VRLKKGGPGARLHSRRPGKAKGRRPAHRYGRRGEDGHLQRARCFHLEQTVDDLRKAPASDVITHVYTMDDTPGETVIPTGTLTVQFKSIVSTKEREKILKEFGLEVLIDLDYLPHGYTVRLTAQSRENPMKIAAKLQQRKEIETAEPDLAFRVSYKHAPVDTLYREQWHLRIGRQNRPEGRRRRQAEEAWEHTTGSRDVVICVMDDGFDLTIPISRARQDRGPAGFWGEGFDPNPESEDDNHGTACAGVALAEENGTGVVGSPEVRLHAGAHLGVAVDEAIVELFQYAMDNNADVISCSWSAAALNFRCLQRCMASSTRRGRGTAQQERLRDPVCGRQRKSPLNGRTDEGAVSYQDSRFIRT